MGVGEQQLPEFIARFMKAILDFVIVDLDLKFRGITW